MSNFMLFYSFPYLGGFKLRVGVQNSCCCCCCGGGEEEEEKVERLLRMNKLKSIEHHFKRIML